MAPGSNRRATGRAVGITLAVVAVATVAGWIAVPEDLQGLVTLLGLVTAVTLAAAVALPRWPEKVEPILLFALVATGTVLLFQSGTVRAYGFIAILLAITILPAFVRTVLAHIGAWAQDQPTPPRPRRSTIALYVASGAMIAASVLGFEAMDAQTSGAYAVRHGQPVTVTLGERCTIFTGSSDVTTVTCPESRWTIDGETYRGTVHIGSGELDTDVDLRAETYLVFRNKTIDAYAMPGDDRAYTQGYAERGTDGLHVFYVVPWWFSLAGPLLIVILIVGAVVRRIRRGRAANGSPAVAG